jgi:phage terminase large subunit-like protein
MRQDLLRKPLGEIISENPDPVIVKGVVASKILDMRRREKLKAKAKDSLIEFARYVDSLYVADRMHFFIAATLEKVVKNEITRLLITAPPQTGKSRLVSEIFPAYWFGKRPDDSIILSSYADTLARAKGLKARDIITSIEYQEIFPEIKVREDKQARHDWEIENRRGEFYSAGVGSGITGRGASLGLIDDPVKNWEEGQSKTIKEKVWDWYESTFRTRIREGGAIILIMTRWAKDDLFGRILLSGKEKWTVLRLSAICETQEARDKNNKELGLPVGKKDPLRRKLGESVAPHRFSAAAMQTNINSMSSTKAAAIYDGVPRSVEGDKVKREWFDIVDKSEVPFQLKRVRYWDPAGSKKKTSKYTAGGRGCVHDGIFYIEDFKRDKLSPAERNRLMRQTAELDDSEYGTFKVKQIWEEEGGSSGLDSSDNYATHVFKGFDAEPDRPTGSKDVRLDPFIAWAQQRRVRLVHGRWNEEWLDEMCSLTGVGNEIRDQADATAGLFNRLQRGDIVKQVSTSYDDHDENDVLKSIGLRTWPS